MLVYSSLYVVEVKTLLDQGNNHWGDHNKLSGEFFLVFP